MWEGSQFSHPHQQHWLSIFLNLVTLVGGKCFLIVVLIRISLMTKTGHPFLGLLAFVYL